MDTNLVGRIKNTKLPCSHALMPLYEAVVNSIHAVEVLPDWNEKGRIIIEVKREPSLGDELRVGEIIGFSIKDNGIGFDDKNFNSFKVLDSDYKEDKGCRGVGRLLWLKAFKEVKISSRFMGQDRHLQSRSFSFSLPNGVSDPEEKTVAAELETGTEVVLSEFLKPYRTHCPKGVDIIARLLLEHCLWFFIRPGGVPKIIVKDSDKQYDLDDLIDEYMIGNSEPEMFKIKDSNFELVHIKVRSTVAKNHCLSYCAGTRQVSNEKLDGVIPGLYGALEDESGKFVYAGYVSSPYLDRHVRAERTEFDFDDLEGKDLFGEENISMQEIRAEALKRIGAHLKTLTEKNVRASEERVNTFVANDAPQYRPVIERFKKKGKPVPPDISNKDLHEILHREWVELEEEFIAAGHDIMTPKPKETVEVYQKKVDEYLKMVTEVKQSDLARYVAHRRAVLSVIQYALEKGPDGKYAREDLIHNLIMPMGKTSDDVLDSQCNLWVIDERLTFHSYLGSDKTFASMPFTDSKSTEQPDLLALKVPDYFAPESFSAKSQPPYGSISVVEFKRPMRNDAKLNGDNPVQQAIDYLEKIRAGKVTTATGRPIPGAKNMLGFCYVVCDVLDTMEKCARQYSLHLTPDELGYYGYHQGYNAWIEIISYAKLVNDAMERNHAFFKTLGLPSTEIA